MHQVLHGGINLLVIVAFEKVASPFYPLGQVAVPEEMFWHWPHGFVIVRRVPFQLETRVPSGLFELVELRSECCACDCVAPGRKYRRSSERGVAKCRLWMRHDG